MLFNSSDVKQMAAKGISIETVNQQIEHFKTGFPFADLSRAATIGDGLIRFNESEQKALIEAYEKESKAIKVLKFVPASGAASRMFKALFAAMEADDKASYEADKGPKSVFHFIQSLKQFSFYTDLKSCIAKDGGNIEEYEEKGNYVEILKYLLTDKGLNYGSLPKGLLNFHHYEEGGRTPLEEHLVEAAHYSKDQSNNCYLHFTVSPEHQSNFEALLQSVIPIYQEKFGVTFHISLSEQKAYTDTIAVNMDNSPFRLDDGTILFRPGGHGALLENVNNLDADIVFIKNIDNVVPDRLKQTTYEYKKIIGGLLMKLQKQCFNYLADLNQKDYSKLAEIQSFIEKDFSTILSNEMEGFSEEEKANYLKAKLNRPIRVCGMVKNEGEPGGGPFWVKNTDGTTALQIVESAQIDTAIESQKSLMDTSTHFNPVDLVCSLKDAEGNLFDLLSFRDPKTGFIAYKSKDGKELKAQELPGLWNGAMADWNTAFVEVPVVTFNPVKIVNDLLRPEHQ